MLVEYIEPTMTIKYTNKLFWTKETPFLTTDAATFVKRLENKKPTFEMTGPTDNVCRVYFDIDYKCDDEKNTSWKYECIESYAIKYIKQTIAHLHDGFEPEITVATSHGWTSEKQWKISFRFWINMKAKKTVIYYYICNLNRYIKADSCDCLFNGILEDMNDKLFDEVIYDHNRKIRCIGTSKPNEDRPLIMKSGNIKDTIITDCLDDLLTLEYEAPVVKSTAPSEPSAPATKTNQIYDSLLVSLRDLYFDRKECLSLCGWCHAHSTKEVFLSFVKPDWKDEAEKMWDSFCKKDIPIFWIEKFAKAKIPEKYKEWVIQNKRYLKLSILERGSNDVAKFIAPELKDTLCYFNKTWYQYDKKTGFWRTTSSPNAVITNAIQRKIDEARECLLSVKNRPTTTDEQRTDFDKKEKKYMGHYKDITNSGYNNQLIKFLTDYLYDAEFVASLDNGLYKLAFQNGILDLKTCEFREGIRQDDLLTKCIPHEYIKPKDEDVEWVRLKLKQICNWNESHLEYYLSMLGYALTGDSTKEQNFWYLLGQTAENGKSIIFEVLESIMPNYVRKGIPNILDMKADLRKEIATWRGLKILWLNELSNSMKDQDVVKALCDGTSMSYNRLYTTEAEMMPISFKMIAVSNNSINIKGDAGVKRRFKVLQLSSQFKEEYKVDNPDKLEFSRDKDLGEKLTTTYKDALLYLLATYSKKYAEEKKLAEYPADWKEEADEQMESNNEFEEWFLDTFEFHPDHFITKKEFDSIINCTKFKGYKVKDELTRMKKWFKYKSQEWVGSVKGKWCGFRSIPFTNTDDNTDVDSDYL
jgi:phage/plasmid-associated DNA primase